MVSRILLSWLGGSTTSRNHSGTEKEVLVGEWCPRKRWRMSYKGRVWWLKNRVRCNERAYELRALKGVEYKAYKARKQRE